MLEREYLRNKLAEAKCYKCGTTLEGSVFAVLNDMPLMTIGHAVCSKCQSQNMVTLAITGNTSSPMESDLVSEEVAKFASMPKISYTELLDLHQALKKESLCKLLRKKERSLENKLKP